MYAVFNNWGIEVPASPAPSLRILGCVPHSFSEDPSRIGSELLIVVTCTQIKKNFFKPYFVLSIAD